MTSLWLLTALFCDWLMACASLGVFQPVNQIRFRDVTQHKRHFGQRSFGELLNAQLLKDGDNMKIGEWNLDKRVQLYSENLLPDTLTDTMSSAPGKVWSEDGRLFHSSQATRQTGIVDPGMPISGLTRMRLFPDAPPRMRFMFRDAPPRLRVSREEYPMRISRRDDTNSPAFTEANQKMLQKYRLLSRNHGQGEINNRWG